MMFDENGKLVISRRSFEWAIPVSAEVYVQHDSEDALYDTIVLDITAGDNKESISWAIPNDWDYTLLSVDLILDAGAWGTKYIELCIDNGNDAEEGYPWKVIEVLFSVSRTGNINIKDYEGWVYAEWSFQYEYDSVQDTVKRRF